MSGGFRKGWKLANGELTYDESRECFRLQQYNKEDHKRVDDLTSAVKYWDS